MLQENGYIQLDEAETKRFLQMYYHPNVDAIRKRDAFISSSTERVERNDDGTVSCIEIPDIEPKTALSRKETKNERT